MTNFEKLPRPHAYHHIVMTMLFCALLTGCMTKTVDPEDYAGKLKDKFTTDIKGDGIKLFTYSARTIQPKERDSSTTLPHETRMQSKALSASDLRRMRADEIKSLDDWGLQVDLGLNKTLDMTGYCREGYIELSRIIEYGRGEIRGECNEGATEADKQKFAL